MADAAPPPPAVTVRARPRVRKPEPWWKPSRKTPVHILMGLPLAWAGWSVLVLLMGWTLPAMDLGENPIEFVIRWLGDWALRFILLTLAVSPAARLLHRPALVQYRRMIGLWAFAYVFCHMSMFVGVDQFFDWHEIGKQIAHNNFILIGMTGLVLLIPLAVTSTRGWVRRMGYKRWQLLHRLVYLVGICGSIHYVWMVKLDIRQPLVYAVILAILLGLRLWWAFKDRAGRARRAAPAPAAT